MSAGSETGDARPLLQDERSTSGGLTPHGQRAAAPQTTADSADVKVIIAICWAGLTVQILGAANQLAGLWRPRNTPTGGLIPSNFGKDCLS